MLEMMFSGSVSPLVSNGQLHSHRPSLGRRSSSSEALEVGVSGCWVRSRAQGLTIETGRGQHGAMEDIMLFHGSG